MSNYVVKVINQNGVLVPTYGGSSYITSNQTPPVSNGSGVTQLSQLSDVVDINPTNNSTLVYNSTNNKFVVQQLGLDGGTF
jgi:hypothetical protein